MQEPPEGSPSPPSAPPTILPSLELLRPFVPVVEGKDLERAAPRNEQRVIGPPHRNMGFGRDESARSVPGRRLRRLLPSFLLLRVTDVEPAHHRPRACDRRILRNRQGAIVPQHGQHTPGRAPGDAHDQVDAQRVLPGNRAIPGHCTWAFVFPMLRT
jgi:hypothetical protein